MKNPINYSNSLIYPEEDLRAYLLFTISTIHNRSYQACVENRESMTMQRRFDWIIDRRSANAIDDGQNPTDRHGALHREMTNALYSRRPLYELCGHMYVFVFFRLRLSSSFSFFSTFAHGTQFRALSSRMIGIWIDRKWRYDCFVETNADIVWCHRTIRENWSRKQKGDLLTIKWNESIKVSTEGEFLCKFWY